MPATPKGTLTRNTNRQSTADSRPPTSSPRNDPEMPATMLMPSAIPRSPTGKASVMMAIEFAMSSAPPMPCTTRRPMSTRAPEGPVAGDTARPMDATVNTANPALYMRTRPKRSPMRPSVTTSTAVTIM